MYKRQARDHLGLLVILKQDSLVMMIIDHYPIVQLAQTKLDLLQVVIMILVIAVHLKQD